MRCLPTAAFSLLFASVLATPMAYAGNVLLPSTSSSSSSGSSQSTLPNLGLSAPKTTTIKKVEDPAPEAEKKTNEAAPATPASQPAAAPTYVAPPTASAVSAGTAALQPQATSEPDAPLPPTTTITRPYSPEESRDLPMGALATHIVHHPDESKNIEMVTQGFPNTMMIMFGDKSGFGAADIQTISTKLGLAPNQVASACFLAPRGVLQTDKGASMIDGGLSRQTTVRYQGKPTGLILMAYALCAAGNNLPKGSGLLHQVEDRFVIPLQKLDCAPPPKANVRLTLDYTGNAPAHCTYQ